MPRRGWAGPNPLLLAATVMLYVVASLLSAGNDTVTTERAAAQVTSASPVAPGLGAGSVARHLEPPAPNRRIGVATFNAFKKLTRRETIADARTLAGRDAVDIIGWQEAYRMGQVRPALHKLGWRTAWAPGESAELAISWRTAQFAFVKAERRLVARGVDETANHPVSARFVLRVVLRDRESGYRLSIINTHLPHAIESEEAPGRWRSTYNAARARRQLSTLAQIFDRSPGRWVIGTGDLNLDARAERRHRPRRGPTLALAGDAASSYQALGVRDLPSTHPISGRHIDYVYADAVAVRQERVEFLNHHVLRGVRSDHRPLMVRLALT